ncbi:MAG: serine--tRNA ligase [bacterium]|nr:serine--tRNA ligase [bacterium]
MLDLKFISSNKEAVAEMLRKRNQASLIPEMESLTVHYNARNEVQIKCDDLRNQRNTTSKKIGLIKMSGGDINSVSNEVKAINAEIAGLEQEIGQYDAKIDKVLYGIPNLLDEKVPEGKDEASNRVVRSWGEKPAFSFPALAHWDLAEKNGLIDFKRAVKLSGARFVLYRDAGAKLERALINFMLDVHCREHHYKEFIPPFIVNEKTMTGTGQLPKFKEDLFKLENYNYYLIPTAEVPLTNIHSDEILNEDDVPLYYTAYTPCFRSEAGSWGKDTRGLIRLHQFNKVELVKIVKPEDSASELEKLVNEAEKILQLLNIHYRIVALCGGDTGFSSSMTYDIEVWLPGMNAYKEISSCSNCRDFQARRAGIRFKRKSTGKTELVHTLNGSGLAVGRTFLAILENYQTQDGGFSLPEVLKKYM